MKVVIDIEANSLVKPTKIWLIVCKDIESGQVHIFRNLVDDEKEKNKFRDFAEHVDLWIGHNILGYDFPNLVALIDFVVPDISHIVDTLVLSKLADYSRKGHSLEFYGTEFGLAKIKFNDFKQWSQELEDYCIRDVEINFLVYKKYLKFIEDATQQDAIRLEQEFQLIVNTIHDNGFAFNTAKAKKLLEQVEGVLHELDQEIQRAFPAKLSLLREIHPKLTAHGTLHKGDFRWVTDGDLSGYNGGPFCRCEWKSFNAASHRQVIDILSSAGWSPVEKTQTHIDTEREINRLKYRKGRSSTVDIEITELYTKLEELGKYGWKVNENNLATLPDSAPSPARTLAKRILYESRRRTLAEWLGLVQDDDRIHGKFYGLGAWTHRMAHQQPNTANIPNEFNNNTGTRKLLGKELRSLWQAPRKRLLVGVDAEGIQLRVFAHYINDKELIQSLVDGRKDLKTDPHSLNKEVLGPVCKTRQAAKQFLYALFLGGAAGRLSKVLDSSVGEAEEAVDIFLKRYPGLVELRREVFPRDAQRGYFVGLDGRRVPIPGATEGDRKHLALSGYLQNGEAVIMKTATVKFYPELKALDSLLVDLVHDEWQTETPNNMAIALQVAEIQSQALQWAGEKLSLKCPMAGSYWNDDKKDYTIGTNWYVTH